MPDKLIHFFIVFLFKVRSTVMKTSKDYFCMPQIAACNFIPLLFLASIALLLHVICSIAQRDPAGPQDSLLRAHIFKTSRCHELYRDFASIFSIAVIVTYVDIILILQDEEEEEEKGGARVGTFVYYKLGIGIYVT